MVDVRGRWALITGASRGIGYGASNFCGMSLEEAVQFAENNIPMYLGSFDWLSDTNNKSSEMLKYFATFIFFVAHLLRVLVYHYISFDIMVKMFITPLRRGT